MTGKIKTVTLGNSNITTTPVNAIDLLKAIGQLHRAGVYDKLTSQELAGRVMSGMMIQLNLTPTEKWATDHDDVSWERLEEGGWKRVDNISKMVTTYDRHGNKVV